MFTGKIKKNTPDGHQRKKLICNAGFFVNICRKTYRNDPGTGSNTAVKSGKSDENILLKGYNRYVPGYCYGKKK